MIFLLVIVAALGSTLCFDFVPRDILMSEFNEFKNRNNKNYGTVGSLENRNRLSVYEQNLKFVENHNRLFEEGKVTYSLKLNKFADMTEQEMTEFSKCLREYKPKGIDKMLDYYKPRTGTEIPDYKDWNKDGFVTPVKDQKTCNGCFAFSAIGALESQLAIHRHKARRLSEQNIVDCSDYHIDKKYNNNGCWGGSVRETFNYIIENGVDSEHAYPYKNKRLKFCIFDDTKVAARMSEYLLVDKTEDSLKKAVFLNGPVSVTLQFTGPEIRFYDKGVYYNPKCNKKQTPNHAALVIGYGTTKKGEDYWIVKNSWGEDWGMNGYIWMARNKDNNCGIASDGLIPILSK